MDAILDFFEYIIDRWGRALVWLVGVACAVLITVVVAVWPYDIEGDLVPAVNLGEVDELVEQEFDPSGVDLVCTAGLSESVLNDVEELTGSEPSECTNQVREWRWSTLLGGVAIGAIAAVVFAGLGLYAWEHRTNGLADLVVVLGVFALGTWAGRGFWNNFQVALNESIWRGVLCGVILAVGLSVIYLPDRIE